MKVLIIIGIGIVLLALYASCKVASDYDDCSEKDGENDVER